MTTDTPGERVTLTEAEIERLATNLASPVHGGLWGCNMTSNLPPTRHSVDRAEVAGQRQFVTNVLRYALNHPEGRAAMETLLATRAPSLGEHEPGCECVGYTIPTDYGTGIEHDVDRSSCDIHGGGSSPGEHVSAEQIASIREDVAFVLGDESPDPTVAYWATKTRTVLAEVERLREERADLIEYADHTSCLEAYSALLVRAKRAEAARDAVVAGVEALAPHLCTCRPGSEHWATCPGKRLAERLRALLPADRGATGGEG